MSDLNQFDHYLSDGGPAALVIREHLMPVEGEDGVLFPATFASGDGFAGGYNIDDDPNGGIHVPATGSPGGVIADGGIRRDATLGLAALRRLHAAKDDKRTLALRRYILGLALTAFTYNASGYLRQGCLLVLDPSKPPEFVEVLPTGERNPATITHDSALAFAKIAAEAFGVGEDRTVDFDKKLAKKDVSGKEDDKASGKKAAKKKTAKKKAAEDK
jgi:CRISPR-associated protein Csb1